MISCKNKHKLIVIWEFEPDFGSTAIVRWCENCGAIVVDIDFDGRTKPGDVMPMMFPK